MLEFGGGDSRAAEGHLDNAQWAAGATGEDECAGVGRLGDTRAVEIAQRVGDVDDGDAHWAGRLHRDRVMHDIPVPLTRRRS